MGSLFSSPKAPATPDPVATAKAQGAANLETAIAQGYMNAVNQNSPYGSVTTTPTGYSNISGMQVPQFTQNITLSPEQQKQFDLQNALQTKALGLGSNVLGNVENAIKLPFGLEGLPPIPGLNDFSADRDAVTNSILERNRPQMERRRAGLETQLTNQGLARGSEAWKSAMDDLSREENDMRLAAIERGGAEQSRLFGIGTQARQQALQERAFERSQPINEYSTLLGLGGSVQAPQFQPYQPGTVQPTDVIGANSLASSMAMNQYNQQMGSRNSMLGGAAGIGGSIAGALPWATWFSDARLKTDITHIGNEKGFPIYSFRYLSDPDGVLYRGVMAHDVYDKRPDAVVWEGDYAKVDYGKIGIEFGPLN